MYTDTACVRESNCLTMYVTEQEHFYPRIPKLNVAEDKINDVDDAQNICSCNQEVGSFTSRSYILAKKKSNG